MDWKDWQEWRSAHAPSYHCCRRTDVCRSQHNGTTRHPSAGRSARAAASKKNARKYSRAATDGVVGPCGQKTPAPSRAKRRSGAPAARMKRLPMRAQTGHKSTTYLPTDPLLTSPPSLRSRHQTSRNLGNTERKERAIASQRRRNMRPLANR
uniref:Uncharacterized protein n=1 Tax=Plectus sambesii TaxID=2011161 RepID=A0A914XQT9_9BILA